MFRYESHYGLPLGRKKKKDVEATEDGPLTKKRSNHLQRKMDKRRKDNKAKIDPHVEEQFYTGRLYGGCVYVHGVTFHVSCSLFSLCVF